MVFVVVFGSMGAYFIFFSEAASNSAITSGYNGYCLDDHGDGKQVNGEIDLYQCNGSAAQKWSTNSSNGEISINGLCMGLQYGSTAQNTNVVLALCNGSQNEHWVQQSNGNLVTLGANRKCLTTSNAADNTALYIYSCSASLPASQIWHGGPEPSVTPSVSITSPSSGSTISGTGVLVAAKASVSYDSIENITISIDGTTLTSCSNSTSCFKSWDTTAYSDGSHTIQVSATSASGGSANTSETITVKNTQPSPPPSSGGGSGGSSGGGSGGGSKSGGGGASGGGSLQTGGSGGTITINPSPSPSPSLNVKSAPSGSGSQTLNTTITNNPTTSTSTPSGAPMASNIQATSITANSISFTWQGSNATSYTIKYGLSQNNLTAQSVLQSTDPVPSYTLSKLPAGKTIYIQITPSNNGTAGTATTANFKTVRPHSAAGAVILWTLVILVLAGGGVIWWLRRRSVADESADVDLSSLPLYPQEDSAAEASRLNWWLPDDQRQALQQGQAPPPNPPDVPPDMYEEGRKRLDDEEKHHQLPEE